MDDVKFFLITKSGEIGIGSEAINPMSQTFFSILQLGEPIEMGHILHAETLLF
ncbi:hypothetical protein D3C80_1819980 [compost metagenome]